MTVRLSLDSSMRVPTCAISSPNGIFSTSANAYPVNAFSQIIKKCLNVAEVDVTEIDEVVACVGPGSYMGVRTAVTTANALGLALNIDVRGVLAVDCLIVTAPIGCDTVAIPAGRGRWFLAEYDRRNEIVRRRRGPHLAQSAPLNAWRASPPGAKNGLAVLDARDVLNVALEHRYLLMPKELELRPVLSTTLGG